VLGGARRTEVRQPYDAAPFVPFVRESLETLIAETLPVSLRNKDDMELLAKALISELWKRNIKLEIAP
jgi:hypothetical protein